MGNITHHSVHVVTVETAGIMPVTSSFLLTKDKLVPLGFLTSVLVSIREWVGHHISLTALCSTGYRCTDGRLWICAVSCMMTAVPAKRAK